MLVYLILIAGSLTLLSFFALSIYFHARKIYREQKNFERGLKMIPILIHLPPRSSDTEVGSRDARDVLDETISKAETLYDIIASTIQKGFKSKFYGQRHFAFEIVGSKGFVHFYAAVPVVLLEVVQQAILSAYPNARLEETTEHNIFNPTGKTSGTVGGELALKEEGSYPIATFQELKRDSMQALLNALSTLEKEDGVGIQILMRPTSSNWRKTSALLVQKKRKNEDVKTKTQTISHWFGQLFFALSKPPEDLTEKRKTDPKPLSGLDQAIIDSIEEKTRHAGFETLIRIVASSDVPQKAQSVLNTVVATFAVFDSPGKNGFKFIPAKDIDNFITSYIMRFFPPENNKTILNSIELATIFHFPDQSTIPTTQLQRQASKQVDGPRSVPETGMLLGYNVFRGAKKKINIEIDDQRRHMYIVGQTGTGKSTFLENLALQDMLAGGGFAFIDPHGDTAERLLAMVPKERTEDIVYFCPADMDYPLGLNLFEFDPDRPEQKDFLIQESLNMLYKLYDPQKQGIIGPRFERIFTNCALLLMSDPQGGTFVDIPKLLIDPDFMKAKLKYVTDNNVLDFWTREWPNSQKSNEAGEVTSWVVSKFGAFLSNEMMRNIIGQTKSSLNIRSIMDDRKILLVNLSKGRTGELNSKLLGMIFVMKFQAAAMSRASLPEKDRIDFSLYVDEFQNFSTDSFADILSEARKYRLKLILANQFTTQLTEEIRDAVFGNTGTIVSFRVGTADADFLSSQFAPVFTSDDLQRIPNYNTVTRMLIGGVPTQPFSMAGLPPLGSPKSELAEALKQLSAAKHGRPKAVVEKEIFARIHTGPTAQIRATSGSNQKRPVTGSSFLDDWVKKRETNSFKTPPPPRSSASTVSQQTSLQQVQGQQPLQPSVQNSIPLQPASTTAEKVAPNNPDGVLHTGNRKPTNLSANEENATTEHIVNLR